MEKSLNQLYPRSEEEKYYNDFLELYPEGTIGEFREFVAQRGKINITSPRINIFGVTEL